MLFISPDARGKGIGALLSAHAIKEQGVSKVDVNEKNEQALGFIALLRRVNIKAKGNSLI
ncbi:GNAT family N-acetyltransferase [Vibrio spartinae]|uniref:GNAT family N-acetyltransferase n=1 Tax=Vibrio spartinae TaxID=1918945 RepID=UPI001E5653E9|nr:GNAT family N-acetyltransferase [Vibrio spartinae]